MLSLNAGVLCQEASLTQMQMFKTSGLAEPEQRSAVSWGEGGSSDLKPAHLLRFLGEGETQTCLLVVIIFTAHFHHPWGTAHNAEAPKRLWGFLPPHLCLREQGTPR